MNDNENANGHTPLTPLEAEVDYVPTFSKKFLVEIDEACRSTRMRLAVLLAIEEGDFFEDAERDLLKAADKVLLRTSQQAREEASLWGGAVKDE